MNEQELTNMTWVLSIAYEVMTNHGKFAYGNPNKYKTEKEHLLKLQEMLNKQRMEMVNQMDNGKV